MTSKVYKTAKGKVLDMGALILQNETVRAVGNMNVNARGDMLDSADNVIDSKSNQIRRQNNRQVQTNVKNIPVHSSSRQAKQARAEPKIKETVLDTPSSMPDAEIQPNTGGLAQALARARQQGSDQ